MLAKIGVYSSLTTKTPHMISAFKIKESYTRFLYPVMGVVAALSGPLIGWASTKVSG